VTHQKITVVTDSSAYIPETAQEGLNISVIPLWLIWDDERFRDGVDIDPQTFYDRLKKSNTLPTWSQPSAKEFEVFFRQVA
jgi:fatty acid-binding protein DegV